MALLFNQSMTGRRPAPLRLVAPVPSPLRSKAAATLLTLRNSQYFATQHCINNFPQKKRQQRNKAKSWRQWCLNPRPLSPERRPRHWPRPWRVASRLRGHLRGVLPAAVRNPKPAETRPLARACASRHPRGAALAALAAPCPEARTTPGRTSRGLAQGVARARATLVLRRGPDLESESIVLPPRGSTDRPARIGHSGHAQPSLPRHKQGAVGESGVSSNARLRGPANRIPPTMRSLLITEAVARHGPPSAPNRRRKGNRAGVFSLPSSRTERRHEAT